MAESSLRAPDLGAQLRASSCLGKCRKSSLDAGRRQPFSGKSFYLDLPAGRNLQFLTGAIQQLGGVIEGFLSKEVSYIVSSRREAKAESGATSCRGGTSPGGVAVEAPSRAGPPASRTRPPQKPADSVPMSRGKELLQKAIRNQGSSSSILTNARSWGVRILRVDEMMAHVQQPSLESLRLKKRGPEKPKGTCPAESRTRRVASLKAPFLKIEDESRKFRPFHHQFKSFPEISFLGPKDASPFEALTTPGSSHRTREPKSQEADRWPATRAARRRRKGYCECCREAFVELHRHLQSAQHQGFAREAHPYAEVDRIIAQLSHSLLDIAFQPGLPRQPGSPASHGDLLCPETLSASQPACGGATSPRTREEDDHQAPGSPEQDGAVGGKKAPADCAGAGAGPGPAASGRDLGASADTTVDSPGTLVSRSLPNSCGFADLSSGPGPVLVGHKRKVQFPGGNAKKRPGVSWPRASFFAPRALSPCDTWTTDGRQPFSLPLPGQESSPLTSILPLCPPQTSLSLPDPFPWQHTDRLAELWATPAPWPGGGYSPGSEDSECAAPSPVSRQTDQPPSCSAAAGQLAAHLHSAACTEPPGGPAESQATSLPSALPACGEASLSQPPASPSPSTSSKLFSSITQGMKLFSGPELLAGGPGVQIRVMPRRVLHAQQGQNRDTEEAQRPRASPAEPEGAWGQAFEVQVNSCDRGQALGWTDLVFPPTRLQVRPRECGLRDHPLLPQPPAEFLTGQGSVMDSSSHGQLPTCQEAEASLA